MVKPSLLVVDDESNMGRLFERLLGARFDVYAATSADLALDIVGRRDFDVIFCDLAMPEVSGVEFYHHLAERKPGQEENIVFFTGGFQGGEDQEFVESLDNLLLFKPFELDELEEALQSVTDESSINQSQSGSGASSDGEDR